MSNTIYAGIDVGETGALCWIRPDGGIRIIPFNETEDSVRSAINLLAYVEFQSNCDVKILLEEQAGFPHQSCTSVFLLGQRYGFLRGALRMMGLSFTTVRPSVWKPKAPGGSIALGKSATTAQKKRLSIDRAKQLYPHLAAEIGNKDGVAEALLLMYLCQHGVF